MTRMNKSIKIEEIFLFACVALISVNFFGFLTKLVRRTLKFFCLHFSPNKLKILKAQPRPVFLKLCLKHRVYKIADKLLHLDITNPEYLKL